LQAQTAATPPTTLAGQDFMVRAGQLFFRVRDVLFPLIFFGLAFLSRPLPAGGSSSTDALLDAVGIAVALSGQLLRALVIGFAYVRRGGKDKQIYAESLQQEGFFAHCRNPLYVGNFLALVGFCIIHNSPLCYLVGIPFFAFAYMAIIAGEERYLGGSFGAAYVDYCRRVPRVVPSFQGLSRTLEGMQFDWKRLIRKEYGSTYAGICAVLVLIVWEHYVWQDWPGCRPAVTGALAVWAPATLAYLVARHLKKSGRLGIGN
jgi:protein-S-isoprenylcysteine O-methyltransferase Ste14